MNIIVKYAILPIVNLELDVLIQIVFDKKLITVPYIVKIPHIKTLVEKDINVLIKEHIELFIKQQNSDIVIKSENITFVHCDVLVPKRTSFLQKIKNIFNKRSKK